MAVVHANKLFRHDEVARIVGPDEIDVISPVSAAYGLAIILDSNLAVVDYVQENDAPRKLQPNELALIATDKLLRVSYLSGVPNVSGDKEVGVQIDQLTEEDGISGKERTIRGKIVLEFRIDRYSCKIANHIYSLMRDGDSDRLTKKDFLKSFGNDTKDNITDFVQTFIDESGYARGGHRFRARALEALSPTLEEYGVQFRNILQNIDKRSRLTRLIWPSVQYDHKVVVAVKLVAYAISITSSAIGLLFAADILPIRPSPMVTIGTYANGTASITGDCQTEEACTVNRGGSATVSAEPISSDYKLTGWECLGSDCPTPTELGDKKSVTIPNIMNDLMISPIFKPFATINVLSDDTQLGRVSCEIKGVPNISCRGVAGEVITLKAEVNELRGSQSDQFINEFDAWEGCQPWCSSDDLNKPEIQLTIPTGLSIVDIHANFRQDRLIKLRVNPAEPSFANVSPATVKTSCISNDMPPSCEDTRDGVTDVYTFQRRRESQSALSLNLSASVPDATSLYAFDRWMCDDQLCPRSLVENPESPETRLFLNEDVTITPTYVEQIVVIINDRVRGGNVEYINSLPSSCVRTSASARCSFQADSFNDLSLNLAARTDDPNDFNFVGWLCEGAWCRERGTSMIEDITFSETVYKNLTLTPIFVPIERTRLTLNSSLNGNVRVQADCGSDCVREAGWETRVTAPQRQGNFVFMSWDCITGSTSCPRGSELTNPTITVTLNHDVTLVPIYSIPIVRSDVPVAQHLSDIASPNCGGSGEPDCSTGRIYVVNKWSQLTSSSSANGLNLTYDSPGTTDNTSLRLNYVGDGNDLYASFRDEDESATGEARYRNIILPDSDTLVVVVEDDDASTDGYVVVEVCSPAVEKSFLRLYETSLGSGVFVGEVRLVANTSANREEYSIYVDAATAGSLNIDGTNEPRVRVVDGEQTRISLPVRNGGFITFRIRDKTGEDREGRDQITTRLSIVAVESDAPVVTIESPYNNFSTNSRRFPFEFWGDVRDSGGSGLQVSSMRLAIDNDYSDSDNNIPIIDLTTAITDGYFTRPTKLNYSSAGSNNDRILVGEEDSTTGLYDTGSEYNDGRDDVFFSYTPSGNEGLFSNQSLVDIDKIIDFQALVYDLAGNVGISDADDIDDGASSGVDDDFQAHTINIDTIPPGLVDTSEDGFTDIRVGTTDVCLTGSTQSGLEWDNADQRLESNDRFIMAVFDEPVYNISPYDFNVRYTGQSTSNLNDPTVIRVVLAVNADADASFFTNALRNGELTQGQFDRTIELLGRTVFLELDTSEWPVYSITVFDVIDAAGNVIDPDRANVKTNPIYSCTS